MKHLITSIFIFSILLISCQKENIEPIEKNSTAEQNISQSMVTTKGSKGRHLLIITNWTTGVVTHVECYGYGGGCGPTITVDAMVFNPILNIIDTKDNLAIKSFFKDEKSQLKTIFGSQIVSKVISGDNTVKNLGSYLQKNGQILTYIQIYNINNEVISSHPVQSL